MHEGAGGVRGRPWRCKVLEGTVGGTRITSGGLIVGREGVSRTESWVPALVGFAMATASGAAVHDGVTRSGIR